MCFKRKTIRSAIAASYIHVFFSITLFFIYKNYKITFSSIVNAFKFPDSLVIKFILLACKKKY